MTLLHRVQSMLIARRLLMLACLLLLIAAAGCSATPQAIRVSGGPGRLVAAQSTVDLGRVPFDRMVEGQFALTNTGSGPVQIVGKPQVKTLEGC